MQRVTRFLPTTFAFLVLATIAFASIVSGTPARAQDSAPVTLRGQVSFDMKQQILFSELKERQKEARERAERARKMRKAGRRGTKARPDELSDDYNPASKAAHVASPFSLSNTLVAPTNTKANDKTGDNPGAGQAEEAVAFLGKKGMVAWNDGQGFVTGLDLEGVGVTVDGGATWTDLGTPPHPAGFIWLSDPSVTVNEKTGEFYVCGLMGASQASAITAIGVTGGTFVGNTFVWNTSHVATTTSAGSLDKEWLVADSLSGNLYLSYTRFTPSDSILFVRSTNDGATWSSPIQVSLPAEAGRVQGSRPCVGPNGEVYVTFSSLGSIDADFMQVRKSTDFGVSFGPEVTAANEYSNFGTGSPGFNRARGITFPSIAVDRSTGPNRGRVYVAYNEAVNFYSDPLGGAAKSEVENNGNFANATLFTPGQTLRGNQSTTTDLDNWKFAATQGTTYIFFVDSLRTTLNYTLRVYCPNDTSVLARVAITGPNVAGQQVVMVWTAPTSQTYYFRWQAAASTGGYRIQTGVHTASITDHARDWRDAMVVNSPDGLTWSTPVRMNDDLPWLDNWLPEVAVPCDGNVYGMWFDWRDAAATCYAGSNIYVTRSLNGGSTWAPNQVATTAPTPNWTQVASNIAPNQGDYNGMYGGDALGLAFADGRLGDADVFAAKVECTPIVLCLNDTTVLANTTYNTTFNITNPNQMFPNDAIVGVSANRNWPGVPVSGGVGTVPSLSQIAVPFSLNIPDTAATGDVRFCFTVSWAGGACSQTCCATLHVLNPATATLASLIDASADGGVVKLSWQMATTGEVRLYRSTDGTAWSFINTLIPDGSQRVSYEDGTVTRGARYWYRLGIVQPGGEMPAGEVSVNVPLTAEFAMYGARPNPSFGRLTLSFSLASSAPARLEIVDLGGRRVFEREVGSMGAGFHVLPIGQERSLPIGVYVVRLSQGGRVVTNKATVIR